MTFLSDPKLLNGSVGRHKPSSSYLKNLLKSFFHWRESVELKLYLCSQEGTSKFASLESCAKEHQKRTHKRLQLQKEMVSEQKPA